jgi:hypothetical protein
LFILPVAYIKILKAKDIKDSYGISLIASKCILRGQRSMVYLEIKSNRAPYRHFAIASQAAIAYRTS